MDIREKKRTLTRILHDGDVWELLRKPDYDQALNVCKERYIDGEYNL